MEGVALLIGKTYQKNDLAVLVPGETATTVFVREESVRRAEWGAAGVQGMKPDIVLVTASVNYNGEESVEYDGRRLSIYRSFRRGDTDEIELYCGGKVGERP